MLRGPLIWLANEREQGRAGDVDGVIQASISLLGNAASHFNVNRRRSLLKYLNKGPEAAFGRSRISRERSISVR